MKHLPYPYWHVMNSHKPGFTDIVYLGDDKPENRKFICEVPPSDTSLNDAILMASAPRLRASLQSVAQWLREVYVVAGDEGAKSELAQIEASLKAACGPVAESVKPSGSHSAASAGSNPVRSTNL